ncbi:MAG: lamin tail domain-containing protein [Minisyncoccota bacterium]
MNRNISLFLATLFVVLVVPVSVFAADVSISEIMYDPDGADVDAQGNNREWIEVHNMGTGPVPLTVWKLFEVKTNHAITSVQGGDTVATDGYAIIADDPTKFLADHPGFSGQIFDSSFSLSNTGETIVLRDKDLNDIDTATYVKADGAAGDGNSLQVSSGVWRGAPPTPGAPNLALGSVSGDHSVSAGGGSATTSDPGTSLDTHTTGASSWPVDPQIFADAGPGERTVVVGADAVFTGRVWGLKKEPIENARMQWVFGDGGSAEGRAVLHHYRYPGTYIVVLTGSSGYFSGTDRMVVRAVPAQISISRIALVPESFIEIKNVGGEDTDLSGWFLHSATTTFEFPPNTILGAHSSVVFPGELTHLALTADTQDVSLLYLNGTTAIHYEPAVPQEIASTMYATASTKKSAQSTSVRPPFFDSVAASAIRDAPLGATSSIAGSNLSFSGGMSSKNEDNLMLWVGVVLSFALLAVAGVFAVRRSGTPSLESSVVDEAAGYDIVEEPESLNTKKSDIPF